MKAGLCMLILLLVIASADAKNKTVYDHTGIIHFSFAQYKYNFHTTTRDGQSYNVGCDADSTSVSCTEDPGGIEEIWTEGGTKKLLLLLKQSPFCDFLATCDPLRQLVERADHCAKFFDKRCTFTYRMVTFKTPPAEQGICVPYDVLDKKGNVKKQSEACYSVIVQP